MAIVNLTVSFEEFIGVNMTFNSAQPKPSNMFYISVAVIGIFIVIVSLVGNFMVLIYYTRRKKRRKALFIVCLAVADLLKTATALWMLSVSALFGRWVFGNAGCQYYGFCMSVTSLAEILLLAVIALERWRAIVRPMAASRTTVGQRLLVVLGVVVYATGISLAPLVGWGRFTQGDFQLNCMFEFQDRSWNVRSYIIFMFATGFVVPVSAMLVLYSHVILHVQKGRKRSTVFRKPPKTTQISQKIALNGASPGSSCSPAAAAALKRSRFVSTRREQQMQLTVPFLFATLAFLVAWTPFAILVLIAQFGPLDDDQKAGSTPLGTARNSRISPYVATVTELCAKSSVVLNPIVYAFRDRQFSRSISVRVHQYLGHAAVSRLTSISRMTFRSQPTLDEDTLL